MAYFDKKYQALSTDTSGDTFEFRIFHEMNYPGDFLNCQSVELNVIEAAEVARELLKFVESNIDPSIVELLHHRLIKPKEGT